MSEKRKKLDQTVTEMIDPAIKKIAISCDVRFCDATQDIDVNLE